MINVSDEKLEKKIEALEINGSNDSEKEELGGVFKLIKSVKKEDLKKLCFEDKYIRDDEKGIIDFVSFFSFY